MCGRVKRNAALDGASSASSAMLPTVATTVQAAQHMAQGVAAHPSSDVAQGIVIERRLQGGDIVGQRLPRFEP